MFESIENVQSRLGEQGYICGKNIATVVYLAQRLEKPVLVEGPAGVGKTELAKVVAEATGRTLIRLQCYEGLDEAKALYEWEYSKQLLYTQILKEKFSEAMAGAKTLREAAVEERQPVRVEPHLRQDRRVQMLDVERPIDGGIAELVGAADGGAALDAAAGQRVARDHIAGRDEGFDPFLARREPLQARLREGVDIELVVGEDHEILEMLGVGAGVVVEPAQRVIDPRGAEQGQRLGRPRRQLERAVGVHLRHDRVVVRRPVQRDAVAGTHVVPDGWTLDIYTYYYVPTNLDLDATETIQ